MPQAIRVLTRVQDQDDFADALTWAGAQTFAGSVLVGAGTGAGTVEAVAPGSGAGNALTLKGSDAASGNTAGGDVLIQPGAKSGAGADGKVVVKAATASPGANLAEWQSSTGGALLTLDSGGRFTTAAMTGGYFFSGGNYGLYAESVGSLVFYSSHVKPSSPDAFDFGHASNDWRTVYTRGLSATASPIVVTPNAASSVVLAMRGLSSQSGNLQEWQDSSSGVLATVSENGYFTTRKTSAPADGELVAGECAWWFDSSNGAAKVMFKGKSADGTVVTGSVSLT